MKANLLLMTFCLAALVFLYTGCDRSNSGMPVLADNSVTNPDPGTAILPHTPSDEPPPDGEDDEGGGSGGGDGNDTPGGGDPGGDQQPVPEPSTLVLVGSGIALISLCRKKKKQQEDNPETL
ncbi:MAG: PEP-CTERM sorting domain-containing protein [Planctomycetota bacterium]|jgi:hypothetical protein